MKPLNLPKKSQEALLNGADMFLVPCDDYSSYCNDTSLIPYQISDEVYLQEDNHCPKCNVFYNNKMRLSEHIEQCDENYKYKTTIEDIKVVRVQDIEYQLAYKLQAKQESIFWSDCANEVGAFEDWYDKQYGNYEDNPYVFLYGVEKI